MLQIKLSRSVLRWEHGEPNPCFPEAIAVHTTSHWRQKQLLLTQETPSETSCPMSGGKELCSPPWVGSWLLKRGCCMTAQAWVQLTLGPKMLLDSWEQQGCSDILAVAHYSPPSFGCHRAGAGAVGGCGLARKSGVCLACAWQSISMWFLVSHLIPQDPVETSPLSLSTPAALQGATANQIIEAPGIILLPHTVFLSLKQSGDEISNFSLPWYNHLLTDREMGE